MTALPKIPQAPRMPHIAGAKKEPEPEMLSVDMLESVQPQPPKPPPLRVVQAAANPVAAEAPVIVEAPVIAEAAAEPPAPTPMIEPAPHAIPEPAASHTRLIVDCDEEVDALMSSQKGNKWRALAVCLAFPAVIGLVLFAIGGEGHVKDTATPLLVKPIAEGESLHSKIQRDQAELAKIREEIAKAEAGEGEPPAEEATKRPTNPVKGIFNKK